MSRGQLQSGEHPRRRARRREGSLRRGIGFVSVLLILVVISFLRRGLDPPAPNPAGTFSFGVMGDAPYNVLEEAQFRLVLRDLDAHDLTSVISVGDIFWRPCSDEMYERARDQFNALRHPVVYTPGDNEWFDCWEPGSGGYEPQERLARLRQIFYTTPAQSLGGRRIALASQREFIENVRWTDHSFLFATVHLIGSGNGRSTFPNRTEDDVVAAKTRTDAAAAWLREAFSVAKADNAPAVVIAMQGAPFDEEPKDREVFEPFLTTLREETERFERPVLIMHGDHHHFQIDRQLGLANLMRLEVPGSPDVGWVRVTVTPTARDPFAFDGHVIPRWKFW